MNGKQLKNSILQWAIQGKLVPQDPNDEPASVLLERIRKEKERLVKEKKIKKDKNASIIFRGEDNSYYEKFLATGEVKCIDEEIPFEIPSSWEWTHIGNIFNHTSGKQQSSSNKSSGTPQKFITTSNLYWGYFVLDNVKVMNFTEEEIKTSSATKGDLLVCEGGAGYGRSAIWDEDYDICLQNHIHRLRPYINGICEYVYYFIYLLKESNSLVSVGTAMPGLSANRLKGLILPFPPLSEQKRIVAKLVEILPLVEKYGKVQSCLDELNTVVSDKLKKSVLQEAIQGKLVPQIAEEGTAQELLEQIKQKKQKLVKEGKLKKSKLTDSVIFKGDDNRYFEKNGKTEKDITNEIPFEIPISWAWMRLNNLCDITNGFTPLRTEPKYWNNGTVNWLTIEDLRNQGGHIYQTSQKITELAVSRGRIVRAGSVLLCCTASVGQCAMTMIPTTTNQQFNALTIKEEYSCIVNDEFLYLFAKTLEPILHELAGKTTFEFISVKKVGNILIPIPPILEQQRICKIANKAIAGIMSR